MSHANRYPAEVHFSQEDEGFVALARDLPGCSAFGRTPSAALSELYKAIEAWKKAAQAAGNPIPEPSLPGVEPLPSGKILLRVPRSLHAALIDCARKEGVSLNQHLGSVLSASTSRTVLIDELGRLSRQVPLLWERTTNFAALTSYVQLVSQRLVITAGETSDVIGRTQSNVRTFSASVPVRLLERTENHG